MSKTLQRAWEQLSIYLPVVLMGVLAMLSWWLVRHAPKLQQEAVQRVLTDTPDYVMDNFSVHEFDREGHLASVMTGRQGRHLPKSGTLQVDDIHVRRLHPDGTVVVASADLGISNADSSEVQLVGNAVVTRTTPQQPGQTMRMTGDFLHAWPEEEKVQTHLPVVLSKGRDQFTGDTMQYDNLSQTLELRGRVKGVIYPKNK